MQNQMVISSKDYFEKNRCDEQAEVLLCRAVMQHTIEWNRDLPKVSGMLQKSYWQGPCGAFGRAWHLRWVQLDPSSASLSYWHPRCRGRKPKRCFQLPELKAADFNPYHLVFFMNFSGGVVQFRADSAGDYAKWLSIIGAYCPHIWHYLGQIPRQLQELLNEDDSLFDRSLTLSEIELLEDQQSVDSSVVGLCKWNDETASAYSQGLCVVCLFDFEEGEKVRKLPCGHVFHARCVSRWLCRFPSCPICKAFVEGSETARTDSRTRPSHRGAWLD